MKTLTFSRKHQYFIPMVCGLLVSLMSVMGYAGQELAFASQPQHQHTQNSGQDEGSQHAGQQTTTSAHQEADDDHQSEDNQPPSPPEPPSGSTPAPDQPDTSVDVSVDELLGNLRDELAAELEQDSVESSEIVKLETQDLFRVIAPNDLVQNQMLKIPVDSGSQDEIPLLASGCFTACSIDFRAELLPKKRQSQRRCRRRCIYKVRDSAELDPGEAVVFSLDNLKKLMQVVQRGQNERLRVSLSVSSDDDSFDDQEKHMTFALQVHS